MSMRPLRRAWLPAVVLPIILAVVLWLGSSSAPGGAENATDTPTPTATATGETGSLVKNPALANLWICKGVNCSDANGPINGRGYLTIDEDVSGISAGAGAFEFDVSFDNSVFRPENVVVAATSWLGPNIDCTSTIIHGSGIIHFACVNGDGKAGSSGTIARITLTPSPDLVAQNILTPGQNNGIVTTISDSGCKIDDTLGEPIGGSLQNGQIPCTNSTVTVRVLEGDLNLDCAVNVLDEQEIAYRYGAVSGMVLYSRWYDMQPALRDSDIDVFDLQFVFGRDGSACANPVEPTEPPQQSPTVSFQPASQAISPGGYAVFAISVDDVHHLGAFSFDIVYDPSFGVCGSAPCLDYIAAPTDFLASTGRLADCTPTVVRDHSVTLVCVTEDSNPGPDGSGTLATLTVTSHGASGLVAPTIKDVKLSNEYGEPIPPPTPTATNTPTSTPTVTNTPVPTNTPGTPTNTPTPTGSPGPRLVGGIVRILPDAPGPQAAGTGDSSGSGHTTRAGLAAGAVVLGSAGAWYARRRWLR